MGCVPPSPPHRCHLPSAPGGLFEFPLSSPDLPATIRRAPPERIWRERWGDEAEKVGALQLPQLRGERREFSPCEVSSVRLSSGWALSVSKGTEAAGPRKGSVVVPTPSVWASTLTVRVPAAGPGRPARGFEARGLACARPLRPHRKARSPRMVWPRAVAELHDTKRSRPQPVSFGSEKPQASKVRSLGGKPGERRPCPHPAPARTPRPCTHPSPTCTSAALLRPPSSPRPPRIPCTRRPRPGEG